MRSEFFKDMATGHLYFEGLSWAGLRRPPHRTERPLSRNHCEWPRRIRSSRNFSRTTRRFPRRRRSGAQSGLLDSANCGHSRGNAGTTL